MACRMSKIKIFEISAACLRATHILKQRGIKRLVSSDIVIAAHEPYPTLPVVLYG
jgi:hypothetical protein